MGKRGHLFNILNKIMLVKIFCTKKNRCRGLWHHACMSIWDERKERNERHLFVSRRLDMAPPVTAVALMFAGTWLCAWAVSAALVAQGMHSMPLRYSIAFAVAYACFFCLVRIWCDFAKREPSRAKSGGYFDLPIADAEGCLWVLAIFALMFILSGVFWAVGGYALLLEVAFEVAFAGTVVRGMGKQSMLGNWANALLRRTWWMALLVMALLAGFAATMQSAAPETDTIAQAYKSIKAKQPK
jgi:hypothetical protein